MKSVYTTISAILFLVSTFAYAQKVDIDKVKFTFERMYLPKEPLDTNVYFFEVNLDNDPSIKEFVSNQAIADAIKIEGMLQAYNQPKHFSVKAYTSPISFGASELNTREEVSKDKDGKITSRTKYYSLKVPYTFNYSFESFKPDGSRLTGKESVDYTPFSREYVSKEFTSSTAAYDNWRLNAVSIKYELIKDHINKLTSAISRQLTYLVGFGSGTYAGYFWTMDSKKHPENETFRGHVTAMQNAVKRIERKAIPDSLSEELKPTFAYFEALSKGDIEDKSNRKIVYASIYNLSKLYHILDHPLIAQEWAQQLIDKDIDKKDGQELIENASALYERFKINNLFSSHFERILPEPEPYQNPHGATPQDKQPEAQDKQLEAKYLHGFVVTSDDKEIEGYLINEFTNQPWEVQDGVRFISKDNFAEGKFDKKAIEKYSPKELKALAFENNVFVAVLFSDLSRLANSNPLGATARKYFIRIVKDGNYKLLRFFEPLNTGWQPSADDPEPPSYLLLLEPGSEKAISITNYSLEKVLEKNAAVFERYKKGDFSKDGKPVNTERTLLQKMDAKISINNNLDLEAIIAALNG